MWGGRSVAIVQVGCRRIEASETSLWRPEFALCSPLLVEGKVARLAVAAERMCSWRAAGRGRSLFKTARLKLLSKLDPISPGFWKDLPQPGCYYLADICLLESERSDVVSAIRSLPAMPESGAACRSLLLAQPVPGC